MCSMLERHCLSAIQNFSNVNMHIDHLKILLKMQTDSNGMGDGLGFCFSAMLPGNADDIGLWTTLLSSNQQYTFINVLLQLVLKMRSGKDIMT